MNYVVKYINKYIIEYKRPLPRGAGGTFSTFFILYTLISYWSMKTCIRLIVYNMFMLLE